MAVIVTPVDECCFLHVCGRSTSSTAVAAFGNIVNPPTMRRGPKVHWL